MAKGDAIAGLALTVGLDTLSTDRSLLITFQLSLSAGQTVRLLVMHSCKAKMDEPACSRSHG